MTDTERLKSDIVFRARLRERELTFHSTWGLFSPRRIDDGTRMLIEKVAIAPGDVALDLGCGYGAIGLALAADCPDGKVHLVDKDLVALAYARKNAAVNEIGNVVIYPSNAFDHVPGEVRFDSIAANLPANVGKELLTVILHDAHAALRPGGRLYVVTVAGLRQFVRRNFREVFGNYDKVKQGAHHAVAMAVKER